jgi:hypothetical protein
MHKEEHMIHHPAQPKYPDVLVSLTDIDRNAFAVLGACHYTASKNCIAADEIGNFMRDAIDADYDRALANCRNWFDMRR